MIEKILEYCLLGSLAAFVIGLSEYFTITPGEKWFPGMNFSLFKIFSEESSKKLMSWGTILFLIFLPLYTISRKLGI